jgi:hypothetical protein
MRSVSQRVDQHDCIKLAIIRSFIKLTSLLFTPFTHDVSDGMAGGKFRYCSVCLNL